MLLSTCLWLLTGVAAAQDGWGSAPPPQLARLPIRRAETAVPQGSFNLSAGLHLNEFGPYCFDQKISHFDDSVEGTFCQRYSVSSELYRPGGPVLLRVSGESDSYGNGSVYQGRFEYHIAKETGALVVWLEHRYYGYSYPVPELSTDNLRFLSFEEALADTANFIRNFQAPKGTNVTDPGSLAFDKTPWILYSFSYAGALVAWMRGKYPDLVWASIASSATIDKTTVEDGRLYVTAPAKWGDPACIQTVVEAWTAMDRILDKNDTQAVNELKALFSLSEVPTWRFASIGADLAMNWQGRSWDGPPEYQAWDTLCAALKEQNDNITIGGESVTGAVVTYLKAMNPADVCQNATSGKSCLEDMGDPYSISVPATTEIPPRTQNMRAWLYQSCNYYGVALTGPPAGSDLPRVASKYLDVQGWDDLCRHLFPPGQKNRLPDNMPGRSLIDELGGLNYTAPRIAWVAGEYDPWYPSIKGKQEPTPENPFYFIPKGGHCWDSYALYNLSDEPEFMQTVHRGLLADVARWVDEFKGQKNATAEGHV